MRVAFLAMVGARDVQVVNRNLLVSQGVSLSLSPSPVPNAWVLSPPRIEGETLWKAYQARQPTLHSALDVPILRAGLEYVCSRKLSNTVEVALFFTDNPTTVAQDIRNNDSLWLARIAERWLVTHFQQKGLSLQVHRVQINQSCSPVNHKEMLTFFEKQLPVLFPPDKFDWVFTSQTGGVPPTYEAMFLQAVRFYRSACIPLYVLTDGTVYPVALREFLLDSFYREQARGLLSKHHYAPLADMMDAGGIGTGFHLALCRMAAYRLLFDFKRARDTIASVGKKSSLTPTQGCLVNNLMSDLKILQGNVSVPTPKNPNPNWKGWFGYLQACLRELYWGMEIAAQQEAWAEFVGRLVRFCEVVLELAFEKTFKLPANNPDRLRQSLQLLAKCGQQFQVGSVVTTLAPLLKIVQQCDQKSGRYPLMTHVNQFVQGISFKSLDNLRDKTILWHGFRGVSREEVVRALSLGKQSRVKTIDDLLEACQCVLSNLGVSLGNNPYEAVRNELSKALAL